MRIDTLGDNGKIISMATKKDLLRFAKSYHEQPEQCTNLEDRQRKTLEIKAQIAEEYLEISTQTKNTPCEVFFVWGI